MTKYFTFKNISWIGMAIALFYLLTCNKPTPVIPVVTSVPTLIERVRVDTVLAGKVRDSVVAIIAAKDKEADYWQNAFNVAAHEVNNLETSINDYIVNSVLPDTCKKYQEWITKEYNKIVELGKKRDLAANNTISTKNQIITQKDKLISNATAEKKKILQTLDTCFKNQVALEKAVKQLAPRREILVGLVATSQYDKFNPTLGLSLGYRNRKGAVIELSGNIRKEISISYKKPLIRF